MQISAVSRRTCPSMMTDSLPQKVWVLYSEAL